MMWFKPETEKPPCKEWIIIKTKIDNEDVYQVARYTKAGQYLIQHTLRQVIYNVLDQSKHKVELWTKLNLPEVKT